MLALAVLGLLNERPMHPYEMSTTMRERHKEDSIKLTYGSLYTVVDALAHNGYITARETVRDGRRPERTVYEITPAGRTELYDWMSELVSTPTKEYLRFEAALSMLAVLTPEDTIRLLTERRNRLLLQIEHSHAGEALAVRKGLPRLFTLETEYFSALTEAELRYVNELISEITNRTLDGIHIWDAIHTRGETDPDRIREAVIKALEGQRRRDRTPCAPDIPAGTGTSTETGAPAEAETPAETKAPAGSRTHPVSGTPTEPVPLAESGIPLGSAEPVQELRQQAWEPVRKIWEIREPVRQAQRNSPDSGTTSCSDQTARRKEE
ncbi:MULTISPECIES: PadR family transcriptional regulator [Protofrankia]|uniref:Transcriptional regulator, PadR-like family n=1 Tax=Candidatus Protofrankia datiscae TaxID=2716812 RepID=F8AVJ9_9ACTN|nr:MULTISPECIES: PadR family transcriptional regulator [Protofrankia]AEH11313.1 transcriptional regulator, PadR-like family [Candidatus Protofrankia datiscae]